MKHAPERMCVICRRRFARAELNRFAMGPDGRLIPDIKKCMPGRGYWLCANPACATGFAKFRPKGRRRQGDI
ncbi:MAG: DUF448 domain-containing protein [Desulfovibrio sp.]|nr:DUF448 domain-containing protein [Desulfovibrio sp.]